MEGWIKFPNVTNDLLPEEWEGSYEFVKLSAQNKTIDQLSYRLNNAAKALAKDLIPRVRKKLVELAAKLRKKQ